MVQCAADRIKKRLDILESKDYESAISFFTDLQKTFSEEKSEADISIALSLLGLSKYLFDRNNYRETLRTLNDAQYMAEYTKNSTAKIVNEYALGTVEFGEGSKETALLHYENAKNASMISGDELSIVGYVLTRIKQIKEGLDFTLPVKSDPLVSLVKIGRSISAVTDIDILLKVIAEETKIAIQADRCTVFLLDKEKNELLEEALEVVGWYPDLIQAKIRRALYGYHYHTANKSKTTEDYNGSAKVALIGVERSIENWKIIQPLCPAYQKEISHLLVVLEQLRSDADEYFPKARTFVRPGFDN